MCSEIDVALKNNHYVKIWSWVRLPCTVCTLFRSRSCSETEGDFYPSGLNLAPLSTTSLNLSAINTSLWTGGKTMGAFFVLCWLSAPSSGASLTWHCWWLQYISTSFTSNTKKYQSKLADLLKAIDNTHKGWKLR